MRRDEDEDEAELSQGKQIRQVGMNTSDIIDEMIKKDKNFSKEHKFEKAQYHQCLPNPAKEGEVITVQLVTLGL